jgi:hypothetical protein
MERDREFILSVSSVAMGRGNAKAICTPHQGPPFHIRLESGDIVEKLEGDADVVPEVDGVSEGTFRWREREARAPLLSPSSLRRVILTADLISVSWCTFVPSLTYQVCWWLDLHVALLVAKWGSSTEKMKFSGCGIESPKCTLSGYEGKSQKAAVWGVGCNSEAVSSHDNYNMAVSRVLLILARTDGAFA